ncbi:MAG: TonB-dependent receptor [Pseudomonadota bacterium]
MNRPPFFQSRKNRLALAICAGLASVMTLPALAQVGEDDSSEDIEEILIIGKRATRVDPQSYGGGLDLVTGETIAEQNIIDFEELITQLPSVNLQSFGPGDSSYIIRGIFSGAEESTVGVYFDESPISGRFQQNGGGRQAGFVLTDLQTVEVYKGPQGTLFGANSLSGTVRFVTNKPKLDVVEGSVNAAMTTMKESDDLGFRMDGMFNLPLIEDKLGLRAVVWGQEAQGFLDQPVLGLTDVNDSSIKGGRLHLLAEPTDRLSILATINYQEREMGNNSRQTPSGRFGPSQPQTDTPGQFATYQFIGSDILGGPVAGDDWISTEAVRTPLDEEFTLASITANYELDSGIITAAFSRFERDFEYIYDSTPTNTSPGLSGFFLGALGYSIPPTSVVNQPQQRDIDSGELRFASTLDGPFNFLVGGFIANEDSRFDLNVINTNASGFAVEEFVPAAPTPVTGAGAPGSTNSVFGRFLVNERDRWAVFGEVYYQINEKTELTVGARYFDFDVTDTQNNTGPDFLSGGPNSLFQNEESEVTYRFNLTYQPTEDLTTYAEIASGFRPGATNISAGVAAIGGGTVPGFFESDTLWNYEVGGKYNSPDGRWSGSAAFFYMDWDDVQIVQGNNFTYTTNGPAADVLGLEVSGTYRTEGPFEFGAAFTYLDTGFAEDQTIVPGVTDRFLVFEDDELAKTPSFSANLNATSRFQLDVAGGLDGFARLDYTYRGSSDTVSQNRDVDNILNPFFEDIPSFNILNLNVSVGRDNWSAGIFVKNITNETAVVDALASEQDPYFFVTLAPRTVGVTFSSRF